MVRIRFVTVTGKRKVVASISKETFRFRWTGILPALMCRFLHIGPHGGTCNGIVQIQGAAPRTINRLLIDRNFEMAKDNRPLSPHLQIHRWQLTMVLSITHRATGVFLSAGILLLLYWIWSLTGAPERYYQAQALFGSGFGRLILLGVSFSLFYHLCNGIRHLVWDIGLGIELKSVYAGGWAVVICSVVITLVAWFAAYAVYGGGA